MAKRKARTCTAMIGGFKQQTWTVQTEPGTKDLPKWARPADKYTRVRITEILPKSKKGKKNAKV